MDQSTRAIPSRWGIPELPARYLPHGEVAPLVAALIAAPAPADTDADSGSPAMARKFALHGVPGAGKRVLAAAAVRDPAVLAHFTDGIFWLHLGRKPSISALQIALARAASVDHAGISGSGEGKNLLKQQFGSRRMLIVLADVIELDHLRAFDIVGGVGALLFSTRDPELVARAGALGIAVHACESERSQVILAAYAERDQNSLEAEASALAQACVHLPLVLATVAATCRARGAAFSEALTWFEPTPAAENNGSAEAAKDAHELVIRGLCAVIEQADFFRPAGDADPRQAYLDLAITVADSVLPRAALHILWSRRGLDSAMSDQLIEDLLAHHLLERASTAHDQFRVHPLCHDALCALVAGDSAERHAGLVDAYAECLGGGLPEGSPDSSPDSPIDGLDDDYVSQHLPYHLAAAARERELEALLSDHRWLDTVLRRHGIAHLLASFEHLPRASFTSPLSVIHDALSDARHILATDPSQLPGQLIGRLGHPTVMDGSPIIDAMVARIRTMRAKTRLCPVFPSLTPPGGPLMGTLTGHQSWINAVAVTPDGRRAVSASADQTVRVWDLYAGVCLHTLAGHASNVNAVTVTPDGTRALSASSDRTIKVWNLDRGTLLQTWSGHARGIDAVAATPDGRCAISGSRDHTLRIWELATGRALRTLLGHDDYVCAVAVTADGIHAISGSRDASIKIWNLVTGQEVRTLMGHTGWISAVAVSADGSRVISASEDHTVRVWDFASGAETAVLRGHARWVDGVAATPDGRRAVSVSRDQTLKVWDLEAGAELCTMKGHRRWVTSVAVTPDGRRAVSSSRDRTLKHWNLERSTGLRNLDGHAGWVNGVAITPDGSRAVSASTDKTLRVWQVASGAHVRTILAHQDGINAVAVTPDGKHAVSAARDHTLACWDLDTGELQSTMSGHTLGVVTVAVTPDGTRAVSGSSDKTIRVWDLASGEQIQAFKGHDNWINAVVVSRDGERVISASEDHAIKIWDLRTGAVLETLRGHENGVVALALSADDSRLFSASTDRSVRIWNLGQGQESQILSQDSRWVNALAVTADGAHLIEVSSKKYVVLWDIDERRRLATFTGDSPMLSCAFHPAAPVDGHRRPLVIAGDAGGNVHFLALHGLE